MFTGPNYTYDQRWVARVFTVILFLPFAALAYGLGYLVGDAVEVSPIKMGAEAVGFLLLMNGAIWVWQWRKGFKQI
jgi:hypothetical protein